MVRRFAHDLAHNADLQFGLQAGIQIEKPIDNIFQY